MCRYAGLKDRPSLDLALVGSLRLVLCGSCFRRRSLTFETHIDAMIARCDLELAQDEQRPVTRDTAPLGEPFVEHAPVDGNSQLVWRNLGVLAHDVLAHVRRDFGKFLCRGRTAALDSLSQRAPGEPQDLPG